MLRVWVCAIKPDLYFAAQGSYLGPYYAELVSVKEMLAPGLNGQPEEPSYLLKKSPWKGGF